MAKNTKKRSKSQIIRDRKRIAELYLKGWYQIDIAEELGVTQSTISRDLSALHKEWTEDAKINHGKAIGKELAKVDLLELEYFKAWDRSLKAKKTESAKTIEGGTGGGRNEASFREEERDGDPRYLQGVQWCIDKRCKLLGLDAAAKFEHSGPDGGPIKHEDVGLTDEERIKHLAAIFERARQDRDRQPDSGD